jgi:hypothetical protein
MCDVLHMRRRFEGLGIFLGVASVFLVFGVLAVLLELQSPSFVQWNGIKINAYTQNGLTYYSYDGENYGIDNVKASVDDSRKVPTTVWLSKSDPGDSSRAYIENAWNRWTDFVLGVIRRQLLFRRRIETMGQFGSGISDEAVRRYLARQRDAAAASKRSPPEGW